MCNDDRYADIYLGFVDRQAWFDDLFKRMTHAEFDGFIEYCFKELDLAADAKEGNEFIRTRGLILALARKLLEVPYFKDGISQEHRDFEMRRAQAYYDLARGLYDQAEQPKLDEAWAFDLDYSVRFGYPLLAAEVLAPHEIFRE